MPERKPRILFIDIETFPNIGFTWGKYEQNVIRYTQQHCIATFSAKWLGDRKLISRSLPDYKGYKPGSYDDKNLVHDLWKLFDEADIICAHNGDQFDIKFSNGRFAVHGLTPPSPFKSVDTKKIARSAFKFNSNKLDDLGETFNFGRKIKTDFDLWQGCIDGDLKCWRRMVKYNEKDVVLLERLYKKLLPWCRNHPNATVGKDGIACPKCGSDQVTWAGSYRNMSREYKRFKCKKCGGWGRALKATGKATASHCT